ncbi:phosphohydrolase [candidate division WWE3 bacterium]|nr:phosphohydrolase [candidate division WWE3 bacterium]
MNDEKLTHQVATQILNNNTLNVNLRRHCYAVSVAMRGLYNYFKSAGGADSSVKNLSEEDWGVVGLLHDADYEITKEDSSKHTLLLLDWLKIYDIHTHIIEAFQSHNNKVTGLRPPQTLLEWSLECCDELTGFIVACALVRPDKKLGSVDLESVKSKWAKKDFARNVNREQIELCSEKLGLTLDSFIQIVLDAMQKESVNLGL